MNSRLKPVRINYNNYPQDGDGLTDIFKSMFNTAAKNWRLKVVRK